MFSPCWFEGLRFVSLPFYFNRIGSRLGHDTIIDGMLKDGLWDVYNDFGMGVCAELCADQHKITREEQVIVCGCIFQLSSAEAFYWSRIILAICITNASTVWSQLIATDFVLLLHSYFLVVLSTLIIFHSGITLLVKLDISLFNYREI